MWSRLTLRHPHHTVGAIDYALVGGAPEAFGGCCVEPQRHRQIEGQTIVCLSCHKLVEKVVTSLSQVVQGCPNIVYETVPCMFQPETTLYKVVWSMSVRVLYYWYPNPYTIVCD